MSDNQFLDDQYPIKVCPELKNGKTLCDIWNIFHNNGLNPSIHKYKLASTEIALLIGFKNDSDQEHFTKGLNYLKNSVDSQKSETSHYLSLCRGKIGSVVEKLFIARELVDNDKEYYNYGVKNKQNLLEISKALSDVLILFDNDFDKAQTKQN